MYETKYNMKENKLKSELLIKLLFMCQVKTRKLKEKINKEKVIRQSKSEESLILIRQRFFLIYTLNDHL